MFYLTFILIIFFNLCNASCPAGTLQGSNRDRCYKFIGIAKSWSVAQSDCLTAGGNLTSIIGSYENVFLTSNAAQIFGNTNLVWVGGSRLVEPGNWTWNDGKDFLYTNWNKGQPVSESGNDCIGINIPTGTWGALSCSLTAAYICEIVPESSNTSPVSQTCPIITAPTCPSCPECPKQPKCLDGWHYFQPTNQCYYVGTTADWQTARLYCLDLESNLVSIHSYAENGFVADIADPDNNLVWTGLNKLNGGDWTWIDGTPLNFWGFHASEPSGDGVCVQMGTCYKGCSYYKDQWNDINCGNVGRFVCKKPPS